MTDLFPTGYRPYERDPHTPTGVANLAEHQAGAGYAALVAAILHNLAQHSPTKRARQVICLDLYQSPEMNNFLTRFRQAWEAEYGRAEWIDTRTALKDSAMLEKELQEFLTDDPVFGRVCDRELTFFFDPDRWEALLETVDGAMHHPGKGPVFIVGPGAMLSPLRLYSDVALYAEVPREVIFFASEAGIGRNLGDDQERGKWGRYKRSFYVDWPVQNRHLFQILPVCNLLVDISDVSSPTFIDTQIFLQGCTYTSEHPFRLRSIFMPGVWGGHRLQQLIPELPSEWGNCAWGFEVVGPENTVTFNFAGTSMRAAFDLFMHLQASRILGLENARRFGEFFPIRFDFLDTIEGTNLSCQVHPPDSYINAHFGEPFAQHEMYYILETRPGAKVYLGLTESTNREEFLADVERAEMEHMPFDINKHVTAWDAARGDLFMIPAGTVHCSGANNLVLEISATPYIYTFKIYDYLRADLDGKPRPISYHRAFEVIDFARKPEWVRENLIARAKLIAEGQGWKRFLLADLALEFHTVERIEMTAPYQDTTHQNGVHVLAVVDGSGVRVVREEDGVALELSYAETGIVPAACGAYQLEPIGGGPVQVVKCYIQT